VGAGHRHPLTLPGPSPVHALAPQVKVAATFLFVVAVAATPRQAVAPHLAHAALLAAVARLGRVPGGLVLRRLVVELPFLAFAVLLPFVATGPRVDVLGVAVSGPGLWAAWSVLTKGTLGLAATAVLVATTEPVDVLRGLERLKVPPLLVAVAAFLLRYAQVVGDELRRLQVARVSRGHDPRWLGQARAVAATVGVLFVRTYERGERVHLAMRSRGYDGAGALLVGAPAPVRQWATALVVPAVGAMAAALAVPLA
jgi:cobalt/nickel transport system permease protein